MTVLTSPVHEQPWTVEKTARIEHHESNKNPVIESSEYALKVSRAFIVHVPVTHLVY